MRGQQQPTRVARVKKLARTTLQSVYRENQIDPEEYQALLQQTTKLVSGVEANEETEVHLQAALAAANSASANEKQGEIPAPPADETADIDYDAIYFRKFDQPHSYIRCSETVEEATGCQYDMTTEDDIFLKNYNKKKSGSSKCSEDAFEKIMAVLEETSKANAPFASVDNTIVSFETMQLALNREMKPKLQVFFKDFYEHWKSRQQLQPSLKYETHQDNDDGDPYVCFRYREVRQTRKTRARDVLSTDRLKRLRREVDDGNLLIVLARDRETMKSQATKAERHIFTERGKLKEQKRKLKLMTSDDDLINQKPVKKTKTVEATAQRQLGPVRVPGKINNVPDADLQLLSDIIEGKENALRREIEEKIMQHRKWNDNYVDLTGEPLPPLQGQGGPETSFRPATAQYQYLMTPPSSVTSESFEQVIPNFDKVEAVLSQYCPPSPEHDSRGQPAYRKRYGRGGRLWIDRRGMGSSKVAEDPDSDRWKYDEDYEDDQPVYELSPYSTNALRFRSTIPPREKRPNGSSPSNNRAIAAAPQPHAPT